MSYPPPPTAPQGQYYPPPSDKNGLFGGPTRHDTAVCLPDQQRQPSISPVNHTQYAAPPPPGGQQYYPPPPGASGAGQIPATSSHETEQSQSSFQQNQQFAPPPGGDLGRFSSYTSTPPAQQAFPPPGTAAATAGAQSPSPHPQSQLQAQHEGGNVQHLAHRTHSSISQQSAPSARDSMGQQQPQVAISNAHRDDVGTFNGGAFRISHRDTNSVLTLQLAAGAPIIAKPGAMIAMSHSITLKGDLKPTLKKFIAGGGMGQSKFTGPGELLLAPGMLGDIVNLHITGQEKWYMGKDAWLANTQGITKSLDSQKISQALFSGEGLFVYVISGEGIIWLTSFGAIIRRELAAGERFIVDNGHLVAWNCAYKPESVASGGIFSKMAAGEGVVCKFTGPGTVLFQSRNAVAFGQWMAGGHA